MHGDDVVVKLSQSRGGSALYSGDDKSSLFLSIIQDAAQKDLLWAAQTTRVYLSAEG